MLRYPCLIVDHDDTVVNSTATVHYPCFISYCETYFPDYHCTLEDYLRKNFDPGVVAFFRDEVGMSEEQMLHEQTYWNAYVKQHVPQAYPGIRGILEKQKQLGGKICVVSHSYAENILRDYRENHLPQPDAVFGWEYPREKRKPSPFPLEEIMRRYGFRPEEMLVVDDLKPGYDMARAVHVPFAAALWSNEVPEIRQFMRENCDTAFTDVDDFGEWLFS